MILLAFDIRGAFKEFDQALAMLPDAESRAAVMRYKFDNDRQLALASQLLRRYVFVKYYGFEWDTIRFGSMTKGGKPVLLHPQESSSSSSSADTSYDFNISHHGHWVILAATDQPGHRVGVDVVTMDTLGASSVTELVESFQPQLSPQEQHMLRHHPHPLEAFYGIWALKESYTKAIGVGLYHELNQLNFYNSKEGLIQMSSSGKEQPDLGFHMGWLDEKTLAAVCYDGDKSISTKNLDDPPFHIGDVFRGSIDRHFRIVTLHDCMSVK